MFDLKKNSKIKSTITINNIIDQNLYNWFISFSLKDLINCLNEKINPIITKNFNTLGQLRSMLFEKNKFIIRVANNSNKRIINNLFSSSILILLNDIPNKNNKKIIIENKFIKKFPVKKEIG